VDNRNLVQEAKNVVSMGLSMLKIINEIKEMDPSYANFDMRIGIHTVIKVPIFVIKRFFY